MGFGSGPMPCSALHQGLGGVGGGEGWWGWQGLSSVCASALGLRPHPHPAASLTPPTRERWVSAGGGELGALGAPYPAGSPSVAPPPRFCYLLAPTWQGAWEDGVILGCTRRAWRVCRGSSPVVCSLSRRARRVVRETLRLPVCRVHPDCPWAPQRPGWDSSTPGAAGPRAQALCAGHLPPGPRLSALGILMRSFPRSCDADLILLYLP